MNKLVFHISLAVAMSSVLHAQSAFEKDLKKLKPQENNSSPAQILQKHSKGSKQTAYDQDELSADVQDLIQEQTDDQVIKLLEEAEKLMAEATDNLEAKDTGGQTIAIETEIIERIYEAAKKKQQQSSSNGQPQPQNGAMMDMLERMMGKNPGEQQGQQKGEQSGSKGGEGQTGDSDMTNKDVDGSANGNADVRRVPKSSGTAGSSIPRELHKALDAFNKATTEKANR